MSEHLDPRGTLDAMRSALVGRPCFGGLDLSSTSDLTAVALLFPYDSWAVLGEYWIPAENIEKRVRRDKVPYDLWLKDGSLRATPGNVLDYDFVHRRIFELAATYDLRLLAYDPWGAKQTAVKLEEAAIPAEPCRQGYPSLSEPSKYLETLVRKHQLSHGGDPVLRWMAENVSVMQDPAGNIRPVKEDKSIYRIDGIVALVMAIWGALRKAAPATSVYETWFDEQGDGEQSGDSDEPRPMAKRSVYENWFEDKEADE